MALSHFLLTNSYTASQEIPSILGNHKFLYRVDKGPLHLRIMRQINPVHTTPACLYKIYLNFIHPLTAWSCWWSLSFWLFTNNLNSFIPHNLCYMPYPAYFHSLDRFNST
jgi:hypothetical protein